MTTVYLTRHGQTLWNIDRRLQGTGNSKLTELGINQAKSLRDRLKDIDIDVIYTSPLERAFETAKILKGDKEIKIINKNELREISFGEYEGSTEIELLKQGRGEEIKKIFNGDIKVKSPGGESLEELYHRISSGIEEILNIEDGKNILIVSHGMSLRVIINYFNNGKEVFNEIMGQATLTKINCINNKFEIEYLNDRSHIISNTKKLGW